MKKITSLILALVLTFSLVALSACGGKTNNDNTASGDDKVITCRPADLLEPELEKYREESKDIARCEEDVLSYALFPQVAEKFFKARQAKQLGLDNSVLDTKNNAMPI